MNESDIDRPAPVDPDPVEYYDYRGYTIVEWPGETFSICDADGREVFDYCESISEAEGRVDSIIETEEEREEENE